MRSSFQHTMPGMFRLRKRKQISVDGHTPGLEYQRGRRDYTRVPATGHLAQVNLDEYRALSHSDEYDPGHAFYRENALTYRRPGVEQNLDFAPTPPIRFSPRSGSSQLEDPPIDHDLAGWMIRRFVNDASDRRENLSAALEVDYNELSDPDHRLKLKISELHNLATMQAYAQSVFIGEFVDEFTQLRRINEALDTINYFFGGPEAIDLPDSSFANADNAVFLDDRAQSVADGSETLAGEPAVVRDSAAVGSIAVGPNLHLLAQPAIDEIETHMDSVFEHFDRVHDNTALERIVENEMARMDAHGMMDPLQIANPYAMPPPGLIGPGMPMDPFNPMPPGPGPI